MATDAEVDLVVNASRALRDVERDLDLIVRDAQANADPVNLSAVMDRSASIAAVSRQVDELVRRAQAGAPDVDLNAALASQRSLRQVTSQLDRLVDEAERTGSVRPITLDAALNAAASLQHINRDVQRIVRRAENDADDIDIPARVDVDENSFRRFDREADRLQRVATRAARTAGTLAAGIGTLGAAAGSAVPLLAGVVAATEQLAPAAALATQGMLAAALASGTLRLSLIGVEEALEAAFDPEVKPEDFAKALEPLAPNARRFVLELRSMRGALNQLRLDVQNRLFRNFAAELARLSRRVMPDLRRGLAETATTLNNMARGAARAAGELADDGTLGTAVDGATRGLANLERVPARVVLALGRIAAAAAPAFDRVTQAVDRVSDRIAGRLDRAFESGRLQAAIDDAISAFGQLLRVVENVGGVLGNILRAVSQDGEGLFGTLEKVTQVLRNITASSGFQRTLGALSDTMRVVGSEVGPLLLNIFEELAPVVERLSFPVQRLVRLFGDNLNRLVDELGPVLERAAIAIDKIVLALEPFVQLVFDIAIAAVPSLSRGLEFVAEVLTRLRPGFERITEQLGPLITKLFELADAILERALPVILDLIDPILELNNFALKGLAEAIEQFVLPVLEALVLFIQGDTTGAFLKMVELGHRIRNAISLAFQVMRQRVETAVRNMVARVRTEFTRILGEIVVAVQRKLNEVVRFFQNLPGRIVAELRQIDLFDIGADIVNGMIAGVRSKIGSLIATLSDLASRARDTVAGVLGISSPSKEFAEIGDFMVQGIQVGLARSADALRRDLEGLALSMPVSARGGTPLRTAPISAPAPVVNVFFGNERLNGYVDSRIRVSNRNRDIRLAQGVRR